MRIGSIVWGVKNIEKTAEFWSRALDYRLSRMTVNWAVLEPKSGDGIEMCLSKVISDKAKRHHIDLYTDNQKGDVERLLALGATKADWNYPPGADFVVLRDPDGNPFCVVQR